MKVSATSCSQAFLPNCLGRLVRFSDYGPGPGSRTTDYGSRVDVTLGPRGLSNPLSANMSADALSLDQRIALPAPTVSGRAHADLSMTEVDDAGLVEQCLAGDTGAFDVLVERHRRQVYQVCYRFVGNHEDASDLAQDAFLRAYRALHTFKGHSAFSTWLYRVAVNVCLNRVSLKPLVTEPLERREHQDLSSEMPDRDMLRQEQAATVRAAIAPPAQEAARHDDSSHVSRAASRPDRRDSRQLGGGGQSELLPRAREPQEAAAGTTTMNPGRHLAEQELVDALDGTLVDVRTAHVASCPACAAQVEAAASDRGPGRRGRRSGAAAVLLESAFGARACRGRRRGDRRAAGRCRGLSGFGRRSCRPPRRS